MTDEEQVIDFAESFSELFFVDPSDRRVELVSGGSDIPVNPSNAQEYVRLVV